jgi:phosphinothricin acetyltransferase
MIYRELQETDYAAVTELMNYYIENSFAAYPEKPVPVEMICAMLQSIKNYPKLAVVDEEDQLFGFGMLRPYHPIPTFAKTAEISYFLSQP